MTFTSETPCARALPSHAALPPVPEAPGSPFLTLRCTGATAVVGLAGHFGTTGLRAVEGLIDHIGCAVIDHLVVEASALDRVDEPGVRMLVALDSYMRARGGRLTVVDADEQVQAALGSAGLAVRAAHPGAVPARPEPVPSPN